MNRNVLILSSAITATALVLAAVWVVRAARLKASVESHRAFWSHPHGQPGGLLYVALGDSLAQGIGASSPERGYVGLLAARLEVSTGRPVQVVNLSVSGARVRDVLATQIPALAALRPDLVTVDVGANDMGGYDASRFAREAAALTSALPAGTLLADVPYFMHGRWEAHAREASAVLAREAASHGLIVVPVHEAQRAQGWTAMLTQFAADWFHPNDRGHRVWADAFWKAREQSVLVDRPAGLEGDPQWFIGTVDDGVAAVALHRWSGVGRDDAEPRQGEGADNEDQFGPQRHR